MLRQLREVLAYARSVGTDAASSIGEEHRCVVCEGRVPVGAHAVALPEALDKGPSVGALVVRREGGADVDSVCHGRVGGEDGPSVAANEIGTQRLTTRLAE